MDGGILMLQPIRSIDAKLLCPCCKNEVSEYPPETIKQGEFNCLKCGSVVRFKKKVNIYIAWITNRL